MKNRIALLLVSALALSAFSFAADKTATSAPSAQPPRVFSLDANGLKVLRQAIAAGKVDEPALKKLRDNAEKAMKQTPVTITDKDATPPSGDKRDFISMAPYHWPDPTKPNGLPYMRRDGEFNPEAMKTTDMKSYEKMVNAAYNLSLAYYLFQDEKYAEQATKFLRTWFLDPKTAMNPNMNYAQYIRGENEGRGSGLIEVNRMPHVIDAVGLLAGSKAWTAADQKGMQEWFAKYLKWLQESPGGRHEAEAKNNHGCYYDAQFVSIALFLSNKDLALKKLESEKKRMDFQFEKDGKQPTELVRTRSLHYSTYNLIAWFRLAAMGQSAGVDLWNHSNKSGAGLRTALDFLVPYVNGEKLWPYKQIDEFKVDHISPLLMMAGVKYKHEEYQNIARKLDPKADTYIESLVAKYDQKQ